MVGLAGLAVILAVLAWRRAWPFNLDPPDAPPGRPSVWHLLLEDRVTIGLARLAIASGCVFAVISVTGLVSEKRWIRKFAGLSADDPETLEQLQGQLQTVTQERDEALCLRDEALAQRDDYRQRLRECEESFRRGGGDTPR